jgi:hypothetical protein
MPDVLRAMQPYAVTGTDHLADKVRETHRQWRYDEKRRPNAKAEQRIQDFGGPGRVWAVVEGQEDANITPALQLTTPVSYGPNRTRFSSLYNIF